MNFTTSYTDDLRLAHILADNVDRVSMSRFKDRSFTVEHKSDGTPVTEVDREVEELLRAQLSRVRTRDGIIGEELGSTGTAARQWVIDPIDGTQNFVRGVPVWATLIALLDQGEPVICPGVTAPMVGCTGYGRIRRQIANSGYTTSGFECPHALWSLALLCRVQRMGGVGTRAEFSLASPCG